MSCSYSRCKAPRSGLSSDVGLPRLVFEQASRGDAEAVRDALDVVDGYVAFTALDGPDISPVEPAQIGKFFL